MFTADVAVNDRDKIAQDSSCMLAHSQGTFCRVMDFRKDNTAPAVGLSKVPKKRHLSTNVTYYPMVPYGCLFLLHEPEKEKKKATIRIHLLVLQQ